MLNDVVVVVDFLLLLLLLLFIINRKYRKSWAYLTNCAVTIWQTVMQQNSVKVQSQD